MNRRTRTDVAACAEALFGRWPELRGFTLRADAAGVEVTCFPALGREREDELFEDISGALAELVQARPEAAELMRGRTFARTLH